MSRQAVRVGIVGCGEVTQILHLPALAQLGERVRVSAVCDASASVLAAVGQRRPTAKRFADYRELVRDPDVDVVLVANPDIYHAEVSISAMSAGKHVLIEKPMCLTLSEADQLQVAQERSGVTVQIGYMRRFAGAFLEAARIVAASPEKVRFARVHDFFGDPSGVTNSTSLVARGADLPAHVMRELSDLRFRKIVEATGSSDPRVQMSYSVMLGLSCHDISAMRELIGRPKGVLYAAHRHDGRNVSAAFDYGGFVCEFTTGMDRLPRFDTFIEIYLDDRTLRIDYDTAYVRNLPAKLTITEPRQPVGLTRSESFATRTDTFVLEWQAFLDSIDSGTPPKASIADSRADLEIFAAMMKLIVRENWSPDNERHVG